MENNQNELSPQELLVKLKESLKKQAPAEEEFKVPDLASVHEEQTEDEDAQILRAQMQEPSDDAALPVESQPGVPVMRYRFRVRRPETAEVTEEPVQQEEPEVLPDTDELLPDADTQITFDAGQAPDVSALMSDLLSEQELAELRRIGNMPNARTIADQAKAEAEQAFELAAEPDDLPEGDTQQAPMTLTEEVDAVYAGSQEYYSAIDREEQEQAADEPSVPVQEETAQDSDRLTPDENSRLNAMNYITSLTKQAAQNAATVAAATAVGAAEVAADAAAEAAEVTVDAAADVVADAVDAADDTPVPESEPQNTAPEEFDEVDVNLMLAFGMEKKLKDAIGEDEAEKLYAQADEDAKTMTSTDIFKAVAEQAPTVEEFTDYSQTKTIFAAFKRRYRKTLFSLAGAVVLALIALFYENLPAALPQALDKGYYPLVNIMFGLQLCVFAYALVFDQLKRAIPAVLERKWTPEIGLALTVVLSFVYQVLLAIFCRAEFTTYNFPVILCVVFALAYEFMNIKRDIYSFNIIASKKKKYALCALPAEEATRERDAFAPLYQAPVEQEEDGVELDPDEQPAPENPLDGKPMYQLKCGAFIDGFFDKLGRYPSYKAVLKLLIPSAAIVSVLFMIIASIRAGSFGYGVSTAYFALTMIAPMSMFITYSYPLYKASRNAFRAETAILGERSAEEYLDAEVLSFEDRDIFPTKGVKVKSIKVYGSHRIDRVVFNAANIFRKYGGPLSQVFNMATLELGTTDEVYFGVIEENGIEAMVGGSHIYLGKADYLRGKGYDPGFDDEDEVIENNGGICVMFMAIEDEVAAKFYIEYALDPEFDSILRSLYTSGVCIGIRTYDPNIDDRMIRLLLQCEDYPVRVIKCRTEQSPNLAREHMDSGIVSRRSVKDMLRAYMSCDRVLRTLRFGVILIMAAMAVGTVISAIVVAFAGAGILSFWAALYQLFWLLPLLAVTKLTV